MKSLESGALKIARRQLGIATGALFGLTATGLWLGSFSNEAMILLLAGQAIILILLFWLAQRLFRSFSTILTQPMRGLARLISRSKLDEPLDAEEDLGELIELMKQLKLESDSSKKKEFEMQFSKLVSQMVHDIRSPLAALEIVTHTTPEIPEDRRELIRSAVARIKDIASSLLKNHGAELDVDVNEAGTEPLSLQLLSGLLETIVSEKRTEYRSRPGVEIDFTIEEASYGVFAAVQPQTFQRVVGRLIDNAVEALKGGGRVSLELGARDLSVDLRVVDNGCGMDAATLTQIGELSGTGLNEVKSSVGRWNASLDIKSRLGEGSVVTLGLPRRASPAWFADELKFDRGSTVVVVDDDATVHKIWQRRLASFVESGVLRFESFLNPAVLREWLKNHGKPAHATYLCDQEFLGVAERGLDLIRELAIGEQSVLVTSHSDELPVQVACLREGLRMVPKSLAVYVPIQVASPRREAFETAEPESIFLS